MGKTYEWVVETRKSLVMDTEKLLEQKAYNS